jgi:hypothetical protein
LLGGIPAAIGGVAAMVYDWSALAKKTERVGGTTWTPILHPTDRGVAIGIAGRF